MARAEPAKRPRAAWRRFVYPAPNACWQMDATEYVLAGGRKCVVFQLIDDHSRLAVASLVAAAETSQAAIATFDKAVARYGVPQRLLTDNGTALNPTRRGRKGKLVDHVRSLGVEPITGKPYKPTTQGKNERLHQTLFRYLDNQPLAHTTEELQAQVDAFDHIYNTERGHQGLPGRITPQQAWDATPVAKPPRPKRHEPVSVGGIPTQPRPRRRPTTPPAGQRQGTIGANGVVSLAGISFLVSKAHARQPVTTTWDPHHVTFTDTQGEILAQYPWPAPGTRYVSTHTHPTPPASTDHHTPQDPELSPMS